MEAEPARGFFDPLPVMGDGAGSEPRLNNEHHILTEVDGCQRLFCLVTVRRIALYVGVKDGFDVAGAGKRSNRVHIARVVTVRDEAVRASRRG